MYELTNDVFYEVLARYPVLCVDYCLLANGEPRPGEETHRKALAFAMEKLRAQYGCTYDLRKAKARPMDAAALLALPEKPWREKLVVKGELVGEALHVVTDGGEIPYWNAFLEPPCGCPYGPEDFRALNAALFPGGPETLEVLSWTTDWSDYFDDGHEWWGAACWSVYDRALDRFAVILASATD